MSPRWFIGLFMLFIINSIVSNILEQQDLLTVGQMSTVQQVSGLQLTEVKDPSVGGVFTSGVATLISWQAVIEKACASDYSFFYDIDTTITQTQCSAISGSKWVTAIPACQRPNDFMILRYIFYWPLTISVLLFAILTLIQAVRGT